MKTICKVIEFDEQPPLGNGFVGNVVARGLAMFLAGFSLVNLLGARKDARLDASIWWIDVRAFPHAIAQAFLVVTAIALAAYAMRPPRSVWRRWLTVGCVGLAGVVSLVNALNFYRLM